MMMIILSKIASLSLKSEGAVLARSLYLDMIVGSSCTTVKLAAEISVFLEIIAVAGIPLFEGANTEASIAAGVNSLADFSF